MKFIEHLRQLYDHSFDFSIYEPYFVAVFGPQFTSFIGKYWFGIVKVFIWCFYYIVGIIFYTQSEGWPVVDTIYFTTVTISTVGYGDFHPNSDSSRLFTVFYMLFGIIFILPMASVFAEHVSSKIQDAIVKALHSSRHPWITRNVNKGFISILSIFILYYVGISFYTSNENFSFLTAMYFTTETMTTVGYGDIDLKYDSSRWFGIFFIYASVLTFATALNTFGVIYGSMMLVRRRNILLNSVRGESLRQLAGGDGGVNQHQFVLEVLIELGMIDRELDVEPLIKRFKELDVDATGTLRTGDIDRFVEEERERSISEGGARVSSRANSSAPISRLADDAEYSELSETVNPMVEISTRYTPVQDEDSTQDDRIEKV